MTPQTLFRDRTYNDSDIQAVCDLINACDAIDNLDDNYSVENLQTEFSDPDLDKSRDLHLWEDENGGLVGFAQAFFRKSDEDDMLDGSFYLYVHPEYRNIGLEDSIMAWGLARTHEAGTERNLSARFRSSARDHDVYKRDILERHGLTVVRYFFTMIRDLSLPIAEPQLPEGFTLDHSSNEPEDVARWVETFNLSFIDHWNHHPLSPESHAHWLESPNYSPERDLIAVSPDSTVAAFCFCWIDNDDNDRNNRMEGWIDMLGTRRGYRKIGLGKAMLLAGLHRLQGDGMTHAKLGVDAANPTGALKLYEDTGFTRLYTYVSYRKEL
ncbi:MAG: GNAT family N-acetyltransferase [Chloroflexia bacterium]